MPAPSPQNKYSELASNHVILRNKMALDFVNAFRSLNELSVPGPLMTDITVNIDGYEMRFRPGDQITVNGNPFATLESNAKTEAYNRLDRFMTICLRQLDQDYGL
jgi:hypothetical protein